MIYISVVAGGWLPGRFMLRRFVSSDARFALRLASASGTETRVSHGSYLVDVLSHPLPKSVEIHFVFVCLIVALTIRSKSFLETEKNVSVKLFPEHSVTR